jgi:hypothetical protein
MICIETLVFSGGSLITEHSYEAEFGLYFNAVAKLMLSGTHLRNRDMEDATFYAAMPPQQGSGDLRGSRSFIKP